jgi:hypothetical protein
LTLEELRYELPLKELLLMRDIRVKRLEEERKEIEKAREREAAQQERENARNKIMS